MNFERMTVEQIKESILNKLHTQFACDVSDATPDQLYQALALVVRDEIMQRRSASRDARRTQQAKKVYYLSAEFLVGRALHNNMVNLVNETNYMKALDELGIDRSVVFEEEPEPGLGNGGLGRLAACFLDSLTTLKLPAMGCTIRYEFGLFRQKLVDGYQVEVPDNWLAHGNIWEIPHPEDTVEVHFGGRVEMTEEGGRMMFRHLDYKTVQAVPYDIPVVGYDSTKVNFLRTWSAQAVQQIDMMHFNRGQYVQAMEERELAEVISKILYPNDDSYQGKELRLKQQYFFSSASIQHAVKDFIDVYGYNWAINGGKLCIHMSIIPMVSLWNQMVNKNEDYSQIEDERQSWANYDAHYYDAVDNGHSRFVFNYFGRLAVSYSFDRYLINFLTNYRQYLYRNNADTRINNREADAQINFGMRF